MGDITKYLNDYTPHEKKINQTKKRSRNDNTEITLISDVEDNEINSEEELNEANKTKNKK